MSEISKELDRVEYVTRAIWEHMHPGLKWEEHRHDKSACDSRSIACIAINAIHETTKDCQVTFERAKH